MKLNKIINVLSLAAVALIATACQDTDAQVEITDVDAPQFLSANLTEEKPIFFGETTIKVAFDKNVGFATKNAQQITINGAAVDKAQVVGVSKESPRVWTSATPSPCTFLLVSLSVLRASPTIRTST